jgi:hypothetical protein
VGKPTFFLFGFLIGGALFGFAVFGLINKQRLSCEADLGICQMGKETRKKALDDAEQSLNQCQQQLKRMR